LLIVDRAALFFMGLIFASSLAVTVLAYDYLERHSVRREEFYILLQAATTGAVVLAATTHFAIVFLGLELLSVSLYGMIAYVFNRPNALEAAVKYLILAAVSSAFLLFGMALIYAESGAMTFAALAGPGARPIFLLGGAALFLTGVGFKLALVPFHLWTPDIYQGAPVPVAAFLAAVSKGAVVSLLLRFTLSTPFADATSLRSSLAVFAIASMLAGNFLGLLQRNLCRLLAYSSIAHLGYVLVAILAGPAIGAEAVTFYVTTYLATVLGAFGVISLLSSGRASCNEVDDYQGLFWRRPALAVVFTVMLFSLAGIPLTGGFLAKFFVLNAGVSAALWTPVLVLIASSVVGLFYYLRVVAAMFSSNDHRTAATAVAAPMIAISRAGGALLGVLSVAIVLLGVVPGPAVDLIRTLWVQAP
jgi:NADH-quinone oxidoreductase subunit N